MQESGGSSWAERSAPVPTGANSQPQNN